MTATLHHIGNDLVVPHEADDTGVPAIVLGGGVTALGVLRVLGRRGIPVRAACPPGDVVRFSRWYRHFDLPFGNGYSASEFEDRLAASEIERAVLFPCTDEAARWVANLDPGLKGRFPSSVASPDALGKLIDKRALAETVTSLDVPHPRTVSLRRLSDLDVLDSWESERPFLKPVDSQAFFRRHQAKAFWIESKAQAIAMMKDERESRGGLLVQEYIPGPVTAHVLVDGFRDRDGQIRALFARRRLRMFPSDFGNSSAIVSVPMSEVEQAAESLRRILDGVGYRGIFSAEFKQDSRDGVFKLLEINVRAWWYIEFAAWCGIDVCTLAYRDALGLPLEQTNSYKVGKQLMYPEQDFRAIRALSKRSRPGMMRWLWSWIGARQPMFQVADPVPAWVDVSRQLRGTLKRRLHL